MLSGDPIRRSGMAGRTLPSQLILVLFFLSGASSLAFENLWQRMMTLEFGASALATTAILTSFFFGIALGSILGGKLLARCEHAFHFYWRVELAIGLFGLAVPAFLNVAHLLYLPLTAHISESPLLGFSARFLLAVLVTLPATLGMGATIPAMNRILVEMRESVGTSVSTAYGLNTIGAVMGCLATGLVFVPWWGVTTTLFLAAVVNGFIAITGLILARSRSTIRGTETGDGDDATTDTSEHLRYPRLMAVAYFLAGAIALGLEVTWMRLLAIYSTSSSLTFTLALAVYLSGFGLGSLVLFRLLATRMSGRAIFTTSNIGAGVSTLAAIPLIYYFPTLNEKLILQPAREELLSLSRVAAAELLLAVILMFLPTLFFGLGYPAICRALVSHVRKTGQTTGRLYFLGTFGSMCGVLLVGLYAIPVWGFIVTLIALCAGSLTMGALIEYSEQRQSQRQANAMTLLLLISALGLITFAYRGQPFTDIPYDYNATAAGLDLRARETGVRLIHYAPGTTGTVTVTDYGPDEAASQRIIAVDGNSVAGTNEAAVTDAKMLAHLPLLLHPDPQSALTVGFGTGGTSWSLTRHPIQAAGVEIEKEVIRSASFFQAQNQNVLHHPRYQLIMDDARSHLLTTSERYDMIATDVTSLSYKHNASLYTVEYFQLMKNRLSPDGVACAWIPAAAISTEDFKTLLRSFQAVYPHATMWFMNQTITGFAILIGTPGPLVIDMDRIEAAFADDDIRADLASIGIENPYQILDFLHLDEEGYVAFVGSGPLHTDDHPVLEFSSPTASLIVERFRALNLRGTMPYRVGPSTRVLADWSADRQARGLLRIESAGHMTEAMIQFFESEVEQDPLTASQRLQGAVEQAKQALGPFRNEDSRMMLIGEFELERQQFLTEHPAAPRSEPVQLRDDLDGGVTLALYPQVGRFRPTGSAIQTGAWASKLSELKRRTTFVPGVGVDGSVGMQLEPLGLSDVVSYFCPLTVGPNREIKVTFSSNVQLSSPATAGLAVVEFDINFVTPEQVPDYIFQNRVVAVRPLARTESGDWQEASLTLTTTPRTRMIHLVFFLDQASSGDRATFDNISLEYLEPEWDLETTSETEFSNSVNGVRGSRG